MKSLLQDLKNNDFKNVYLLYGEEDYLKKQYKKRLQDALISPEDTVNLNSYEGKNISVKELIDQSETMPFFAERRLLLVEDSGFFKTASQELADYLETLPETSFFVFVETEVDKRGKLYKTVKKKGRVVEFTTQNEETLTRWILGNLKKENKNITRSAMQLFLEKTGTDMNNIATELEKLLCYTADKTEIRPEDVEAICTTQTVNRIFDMISAVADGNQKKALDLYDDLLALKEPPMRILFLLTRQFNQLFQVKQMRALGYDAQGIGSKLGMQGFVAKNCLRQSSSFEMDQLKALVEECVNLEEAVKTGNLNEKLAVELILTEAGKGH